MKANTFATLLSLALISAGSVLAQTATTAPVGFSTLSVPVGTSLVVPTLNNTSVFTGMAAISSDGLTITPTTAPSGWSAGAYAKTAFTDGRPNYPTYYAEVIAATQEGLIIDLSTNSTTALTALPNEITAASGIRGTTVQIAIRQHVTLDKVIVGATGLTGFNDSISVFNSNGSQSICNYDGVSFLDGNFDKPVGHTVIYPGTGFVITVGSPATLSFMGSVKMTKTQINLFSGATNIVGPLNPASSTLFYGNTSLAAALDPYNDGINNFGATGTMTTLGTYSSDGVQMLDGNFNPLPPSATDAIALNRGVVVTVGTDRIWTVNSPVPPAP